MTEEDDTLREGYATFNRGDFEQALTYWHPDAVIDRSMNFGDPGVYEGLDGVRRFYESIFEQYSEFRIEPEEVIPAGEDKLVVIARTVGRHKLSGMEVEDVEINVWTLRDGKAIHVQLFSDRDEALQAAGLDPAAHALD